MGRLLHLTDDEIRTARQVAADSHAAEVTAESIHVINDAYNVHFHGPLRWTFCRNFRAVQAGMRIG